MLKKQEDPPVPPADPSKERTEKAGYLARGGNKAVGVSQEKAAKMVLESKGKCVGYTFCDDHPDYCWVKMKGAAFVEYDGWTTVTWE